MFEPVALRAKRKRSGSVHASGRGDRSLAVSQAALAAIEPLEQRVMFSGNPAWLAANSAAMWDDSSHTLTVSGAATIVADPAGDEPNIVASGSAAQLTIAVTSGPVDVHVGGISLSGGATLTMASVGPVRSNANHNTLVLGTLGSINDPTLSVDSTSRLDLQDNDLIVHTGSSDTGGATAFGNAESLATEGRNPIGNTPGQPDGQWNGNGLSSSAANAADSAAGYETVGLAVVVNSTLATGTLSAWKVGSSSETLGANDVIAKYDYLGDYALEGAVTADDAAILSAENDGGTGTSHTWATGSSLYDGLSDANESGLFQRQSGLGVTSMPAAVNSVVINGNNSALVGVQRSMVNSIVYTFNQPVTLNSTSAFTIAVHSGQTGTIPTLNWAAVNPDGNGASAQWIVTFSGSGVLGGSIANGVYDITLNTAAVTSESNPLLPALPHNTDTFYRLFGDVYGTESVTAADYNLLKKALRTYDVRFDYNGDGVVDITDYNQFANDLSVEFTGFSIIDSAGLRPTNVAAAIESSNAVTVSWAAPVASGVTGYSVERWSAATSSWTTIAQHVPSAGTSYIDTQANPDGTYIYKVAGEQNGLLSDWSISSNEVWTRPQAPSNLSATVVSSSQVNLSWTNSSQSATGIVILISTNGSNFSMLTPSPLSPSQNTYSVTGLSSGQSYRFQVVATAPGSQSAPATVAVPAPTTLDAATLSSDLTVATGSTLNISDGLTLENGVTITVEPGATLNFLDGTSDEQSVSGNGSIVLEAGSASNTPGQIEIDGANSDSSVTFDNGVSISGPGTSALPDVVVAAGNTVVLNNTVINASIAVAHGGDVEASGATLSGGAVSNSGTMNVTGGLTLSATVLDNFGSVTVSGYGNLYDSNAATIDNEAAGVFNIAGGGTLNAEDSTFLTFSNNGLLEKTDSSPSFMSGVTLKNGATGTVVVGPGELDLGGGSSENTTGTAFTVNGGTLVFNGGTFTFNGNAAMTATGGGQIEMNNGNLVINGGTLSVNGVSLSEGAIGSTGSVSFLGTDTLNNGNEDVPLKVDTGAVLNITGSVGLGDAVSGLVLDNYGTVNLYGNLNLYNSASVQNEWGAVFNVFGGSLYGDSTATTFDNFGLVQKTDGSWSSVFGLTFNNEEYGKIVVDAGRFEFYGGAAFINADDYYTAVAANGGVVDFNSGSNGLYTFSTNATMTASAGGQIEMDSGNLAISGNALVSVTNLNFSGGTIDGTGSLSLSGSNTWAGQGQLSVPLTVTQGATVNISIPSYYVQPSISNLTNDGSIELPEGDTLTLTGNWTNASGTISVPQDAVLSLGGSFTTAKIGTLSIAPGTQDGPGGQVQLAGTLDNTGATLTLTPATVGTELEMEDGGTIIGGTINDSAGASISVGEQQTGTLDGVTFTGGGNIDATPEGANLTVKDGLTFDGTLTVGDASTLELASSPTTSSQTIGGTGTIIAEQTGSVQYNDEQTDYIKLDSGVTATLGSSATLQGGAIFQGPADATFINDGTIIAGPEPAGSGSSGNQVFVVSGSLGFNNLATIQIKELAAWEDASGLPALAAGAYDLSPTEVVVGWYAYLHGIGLSVYMSTDGGSFQPVSLGAERGNYLVMEGLTPNHVYDFIVVEQSTIFGTVTAETGRVTTNLGEPSAYASAFDGPEQVGGAEQIGVSKDGYGLYRVPQVFNMAGQPVSTGGYGRLEVAAGSAEGAMLQVADEAGLLLTGNGDGEALLPYAYDPLDWDVLGIFCVHAVCGPGPCYITFGTCNSQYGGNPDVITDPKAAKDGDPVIDSNGETYITNTDLSSTAFGDGWNITRNWTAQGTYVPDSTFGNGWMNQSSTYIVGIGDGSTSPNILLVQNAYAQTLFGYNATSETYAPASVSNDTLTYNSADDTYTWLNASTYAESTYYGFNSSITRQNLQGKLKSYQDAGGNQTNLEYNTDGTLSAVTQSDAAGAVETFQYTYSTLDGNPVISLIQQSIQRPGDSAPAIFRQAAYAYYQGTYTGDDAYGNLGDLKTVAIEDGQGNVLSEDYYRYYTPDDIYAGAQGFVGGLAYSFSTDSFAKLAAAYADPFSATNAQVAPYADEFYEYDSFRRVTQEVVGSMGASSALGQGTYLFSYDPNPDPPADPDLNTWEMRTTVTLPDGNQNIVYTSINGDQLLEIENVSSDAANPSNVGKNWITGDQYDSFGRQLDTISPSAINLGATILNGATDLTGIEAAIEQYDDLGLSEGLVYANQGLITGTDYYSSTDATGTTAGGATGFTQDDYVRQGLSGSPIKQDAYTYFAHTDASGLTVYPEASYTQYQSDAGGGSNPQTTTYGYAWQTNASGITNQIQIQTTTDPVVSAAQNGSGTAISTQVVYNTFGQPVWTLDGNGYITYTGYDNATGAVIQSIQDVNTENLSDLANYAGTSFTNGYNAFGVPQLPATWATIANAGLNLVTTNFVDDLGRTIEQVSPAGNITLYVYDDVNRATFTLPGVVLNTSNNTLTTTGPVTMVRTEVPYSYTSGGQTLEGLYDETLTFSINTPISYTGGSPGTPVSVVLPGFVHGGGASSGPANVLNLIGNGTSASPQFTIQSLARNLYDSSGRVEGQMVESDAYAAIDNATYLSTLPGNPYSGGRITNQLTGQVPNGNYYTTFYAWNLNGWRYQTIDANGTIYDTVFDALDRPVSQWVGTNDAISGASGTPSYFVGSNSGAGNNMTEVESAVYDGGGVGDGNLTEMIQYPNGNAAGAQDVTLMGYDFRDRPIATESGLTLDSSGAATTSSSVAYPPIAVQALDNLGDVVATLSFNGDATSMAAAITTAGSAAPGAALTGLVGYSSSAFDSLDRDYQDQTYSVDPASGTISTTALTNFRFYDSRDNVIASVDPTGQVTKDVYDGAGRLAEVFVTDGGAVNNGGSPVLTYSAAGSVFSDVVVEQTAYGYDGDSNLIETVDAKRLSTDPVTAVGALFAETNNSDGSLNITPASGSNPSLGARIDYAASYYDAADRDMADVSVGDNGGVSWARPGSVPSRSDTVLVTGYGFDAAGNQAATTDPKGIVTQRDFDALGRTTETIADYTNGIPTGNSNQTTAFTYDGGNDVTSQTAVMPAGTANQATVYLYGVTTAAGSNINSNDLLGEVEYPDPSTGVAGASASDDEMYAFDALGEQTRMTDRNGTTHLIAYDSLGREVSDTATVAPGNPENVDTSVTELAYNYNNQGLPFQQTSLNSSGAVVNQVQDAYNGLGQLTSQYQSVSGPVNTSTTPHVGYVYSDPNNGSRLTEMIYPNGRLLYYGYDGNALDNAIGRVDYLADATTAGTVGAHDVDYQYLGLSTIVGQAQGDGVTETTTLNALGEISEIAYVNTTRGTSTDDFQYGYDRDANVLYEANGVNSNFSQLFSYDSLSRLASFQRGTLNADKTSITTVNPLAGSSQSWNLDAVGNQSSVTTDGVQTNNAVNDQNQLTANGSAGLAYDSNGNTTRDADGDTYVWDAWNRLVAVKHPAGTTLVSYTYNANGGRIIQVASGVSATFYLSGQGQVIEERQGSTVTAQNVWNIDYVNDLLLRDDNSVSGNLGISGSGLGNRLYAQHDLNFSITGLIDTSGNVLERVAYTPYGQQTVLVASWTTAVDAYNWSYYFQGMRLVPDGRGILLLSETRPYNTMSGTWMGEDPARYVNGLNLYQFTGDAPTRWMDPSGLLYKGPTQLPVQSPPPGSAGAVGEGAATTATEEGAGALVAEGGGSSALLSSTLAGLGIGTAIGGAVGWAWYESGLGDNNTTAWGNELGDAATESDGYYAPLAIPAAVVAAQKNAARLPVPGLDADGGGKSPPGGGPTTAPPGKPPCFVAGTEVLMADSGNPAAAATSSVAGESHLSTAADQQESHEIERDLGISLIVLGVYGAFIIHRVRRRLFLRRASEALASFSPFNLPLLHGSGCGRQNTAGLEPLLAD